jgi:hypothetical protein
MCISPLISVSSACSPVIAPRTLALAEVASAAAVAAAAAAARPTPSATVAARSAILLVRALTVPRAARAAAGLRSVVAVVTVLVEPEEAGTRRATLAVVWAT